MRPSNFGLALGSALAVSLSLSACQRPNGVPAEAVSSSTLLNGKVWSWTDHTTYGPVVWTADSHGLSFWIKMGADIFPDPRRNPGPALIYSDDNGLRASSLASSPGAGRPCDNVPTSDQIAIANHVLREAARNTSNPVRRQMLEGAAVQVHRLAGAQLVTDVGGACTFSR